MEQRIYAIISAGSVEYSKSKARVDIDELIDQLQQAKEDGATHVLATSGNYRGAQWVRLGEVDVDDEGDGGHRSGRGRRQRLGLVIVRREGFTRPLPPDTITSTTTKGNTMKLSTIISLAKEYAALGWSVQEQLSDFVDCGDEVNANAVRVFQTWIREVKREAISAQDTALAEDCGRVLDEIEDYFA